MTDEQKTISGPPWKIVGRFSTYKGANEKRNELKEDADYQVKVHFMPGCWPKSDKYFAVKSRISPEIILAQEVVYRRLEKKARKKKLNKKRRKK